LTMSSGYHPQTDGQTERMNRTLEEMLRAFCGTIDMQHRWEDYLPLAEFQYNNSVQTSTSFTPFYLNSGQHPHTPASLTAGADAVTMRVPSAETWLKAMDEALAAAKAAMERAQATQALYYNRHRRPVEYSVGDQVYVAVQGLPDNRRGSKVCHRRRGPYRVAQRVGKNAYRLDLPVTWNVHPVFHVSYLQPHRPDSRSWHEPPKLAKVVEARYMGPQGERTLWFQVQHERPGADDDVWLTAAELQQAAPALYIAWHQAHDESTVPVKILAERSIDDDDDWGVEFQVLYNDGVKLWIKDRLLRQRAPTLVDEFYGEVDSDDEADPADAVPTHTAPAMRLRVMRMCALQWQHHAL